MLLILFVDLMIVENSFLFNYILMQSNSLTKWTIAAVGAVAIGIGALYWKNKRQQITLLPLSKQQVIHILKLIRRNKYRLYKQIATFSLSMSRQMRGNISTKMIEQFLNGPESPLKLEQEINKIEENICSERNTTTEAFNTALQNYKNDEEVMNHVKTQERDFQVCVTGRLPVFQVILPATFTKERFLTTQNQITKKTYLQQVAILKKLSQRSEEELQQDPEFLAQMTNHENELEEILVQEGLGSEFEPPYAVYESATLKYRNDPTVRTQIAKIQEGYQKIMMRYSTKIQSRTMRPEDLTQMEDEIIYFDPIVA